MDLLPNYFVYYACILLALLEHHINCDALIQCARHFYDAGIQASALVFCLLAC